MSDDIDRLFARMAHGESEAVAEEAAELLAQAEQTGDLAAQVRLLSVLGQSHGRRADWARAVALLERARALAREHGLPPSNCCVDLGMICIRLGAYERAIELLEEGDAWERAVSGRPRVAALNNLGFARMRSGDSEGALKAFERAVGAARAQSSLSLEVRARAGRVLTLLQLDRGEAAHRELDVLQARAEDCERAQDRLHFRWARAHVRLAEGDPRALEDAVVCLEAAETSDLDELIETLRLTARAAALAGNPGRAYACERRAADLSSQAYRTTLDDALSVQAMRNERDRARATAELRTWILTVVSHELRTPLHGLLGAAALLAERPLDEASAELVQTIRSSGTLMRGLVGDLLDAASLEAGALRLDPAPVDPPALIEETLGMLRISARGQGVGLCLVVRAGTPRRALLDRQRVSQIVLNLAGNALKFTRQGTVRVEVGSHQGRLVVYVDDEGPGIDPADRDRIFEAFAQAEVGASRPHGGFGLGLTISRKLARLSGGDLSVGEAPTGGARFTLEVPEQVEPGVVRVEQDVILDLEEAERSFSEEPTTVEEGLRVLVVDDEPVSRRVESAMLRRLGAAVTACASGVDALAAFDEACPDVVVLDWMMPGMDGPAVARSLRERGYDGAILALTANAEQHRDTPLLDDGTLQAVLAKPIALEALGEALERWSRRRD